MKRLIAGLALVVTTAMLSGCYYDPGYGYVRSTAYSGDVYYGNRSAVVYDSGYYPSYYGGYYGCCYAPGVSVGWYGGSRWRGHDWDRGRDWGHDRGHWRGGDGGRGRGGGREGRHGDWHDGRGSH
ncbi:lipoprotein [Dyella tabacisoli]|uniref:Lipoprotein n=1 Tax=Dyella tabacisoli TaxID=2282381 RepID=A0A369UMV6_9GAMM|nr:hypothetical protein [Dyella tabacisoli]RDD81807.1 hypothetical protein DVJ77_11705 [Dyella tabacisoli]